MYRKPTLHFFHCFLWFYAFLPMRCEYFILHNVCIHLYSLAESSSTTFESNLTLFYELIYILQILFIINGYLLYRLVTLITEKERLARTAVLVFSWSPASIFFSSLYSESLYFSFTLAALIHLYQRPDDRWNQLFSSFIFSFAYL
jgi:Gpi18-like mannosyltransferase